LADTKISALTDAGTITGSEELPVVQAGVTKRVRVDELVLTASQVSDFAETARDAIGTALVAGNNIDITVNDAGDTITIDVEALTTADVSGLGGAAVLNVGTTAGTVAAGDDSRITGAATATDLTNHLNDTADAHDASAISFSPAGTIAATDVQAAVAEVASDAASALSTHESDSTSVHGIADTSVLLTTGSSINDLTDVTIATPSTGQVLKYNGSAWVNDTDATGGGGGALDDLTDVTITAAASGDLLRFDGAAWVDYPDSNYAAASHTHAASDITSGTIDTARLGSGTASASTYLRGDQTWATVSAGSADPQSGALFFGIAAYGGF
jgi:hypothetical protein